MRVFIRKMTRHACAQAATPQTHAQGRRLAFIMALLSERWNSLLTSYSVFAEPTCDRSGLPRRKTAHVARKTTKATSSSSGRVELPRDAAEGDGYCSARASAQLRRSCSGRWTEGGDV